jgi:hypothetical protein
VAGVLEGTGEVKEVDGSGILHSVSALHRPSSETRNSA